jgi:hypothetical protein
MQRGLSSLCAAVVAVAWLFACGGDDGDGASLVDRLLALDQEQDSLECDCDPDTCSSGGPGADEVECIKSVVAMYSAQIDPELRCSIRRFEAQNRCFAAADCNDIAAWEACYDVGEDCDDSFTESIEHELEPCEDEGGAPDGG